MKSKKFVCTADPYAGFMISFENGYTVSVQWSNANYCENRFKRKEEIRDDMGYIHSNTAEVAVWKTDDPNQEFIDANKFVPDGIESFDEVIGHLSPENVVEFLKNVKDYQDVKDVNKPFVIKDFDSYGYGHYAEIYSNGNTIKIGNIQPREGGIYWSGSREEFLKRASDFEKESITLVEAIKNYLRKIKENNRRFL